MLSIGNIKIDRYPLLLAPMEDVTDPTFRIMCREFGADLVYTEFISSDGLIRGGKKSVDKLNILDEERPAGIQLYGHIPEAMAEAAAIAEKAYPELIDINFGCPVRKIAGRGAGAGMLNNIPAMVAVTESVIKSTQLPVTVKTRLGWDETQKNILEIALILQDLGIKAITIHGRTRSQMYKGKADWTLIGEVKHHPLIHIPVIGNGDIDSPEKAKEMFDQYGVDGIMIGRAAIGRPWIFREIKHFLLTGEKLPEPSVREKVEWARRHFLRSVEYKGIPRGIFEMRRHFSNYFKGLPGFKEIRLKLVTSVQVDEILGLLDLIALKYEGYDYSSVESV